MMSKLRPAFLCVMCFWGLPCVVAATLSDPRATPETVQLFENLKRVAKDRLLYGQYRAFTSGKFTQSDADRAASPSMELSDTRALIGKHPAIVEFGLHKTEYYDYWRAISPEIHRRGILISLSSHSRNPDLAISDNGSHKDNRGDPVAKVLDERSHDHAEYIKVLRGYGKFIQSLRDDSGRPIPVFVRLYHEHNGGWFWWGSKACSPQQYNELWKMTADFFRNEMNLHNLILVLSPSKPDSVQKYMRRFPGTDYVDVFGFDCYADKQEAELMVKCARTVAQLARQHGKIAAITEFGYKNGISQMTDSDYYRRVFLENIARDSLAREVVYALTWFGRKPEQGETKNWSPYRDEPSSKHVFAGFREFFQSESTIFEGDLPSLYLSQPIIK